MFSKACEYGIRATIYISLQSMQDKRQSLKDIAQHIDSPVAFTAKILQQLVKHNIINSVQGATGGFEIEKQKIKEIKLQQIVKAIDGSSIYMGCGLGLSECSEKNPCPVHYKFKAVREKLRMMLEETSLYELVERLESGLTFLKI